jgi:putative ABC transport system permease protein
MTAFQHSAIPRPKTGLLADLSPLRVKRALILGLKSLWLHRLRSLLTVLGIVFGVCSVIAMLAIGEGASYAAQQQIRQLGSNNIIVRSVKPPEDTNASSAERSFVVEYGLTYADVRRIEATIPGVRTLVPARVMRKNVFRHARRINCDIFGAVPWYPDVASRRLVAGRFFSQAEHNAKANVAVLDEALADELFPLGDAIGSTVRVEEDYFRVIGIMGPAETAGSSRGRSSGAEAARPESAGASASRMFIPLSSATGRFGEIILERTSGSFSAERVELHELIIQVENIEDVVGISLVIDDMLGSSHKKNDYEIVVPLELLRQAENTKRIFNIVLGSVAAISLLVGGIGIMNIMLATVTERTREIGIRRALGAKKRDIVFQFLIETVLLSGTGGALGVALGLGIPFMITFFSDMMTIVTVWAPLIAFSISALVGILFGIYPAMRAANMDPVEALRHE